MPRDRFSATPWLIALVAVGLAWPIGDSALAQIPEPPQPSPATRAKLYEELRREVAALQTQGNLLKKVVKVVKPAVVHVEAKKTALEESSYRVRRPLEEAGSGVVIELGGKYYVLTNRHVISDAPLADIKIGLADGRELHPVKKWEDAGTDVAVMAITAVNLAPARLGNSDKVEIGDFVLAVGSPFGLSHSVTYGIVSAKGRRDLKLGAEGVKFQDFFQTDAAINPGNSGGPLVNLRGEVVGINTAIASNSGGNEGIGFAIPVNMFMIVAKQLIEHGSVVRAFLGVHLDSKFGPEKAAELGLPRPKGAHVTGITPHSPAEAAKIQTHDVILQFDGAAVENDSHLVNLVSLTPVHKEVRLLVYRNGKTLTFKVKVGDRAQFERKR